MSSKVYTIRLCSWYIQHQNLLKRKENALRRNTLYHEHFWHHQHNIHKKSEETPVSLIYFSYTTVNNYGFLKDISVIFQTHALSIFIDIYLSTEHFPVFAQRNKWCENIWSENTERCARITCACEPARSPSVRVSAKRHFA